MIRALTPVVIAVAVLILRGWQLSQRTFYWDDLVIPARFRDTGLWAPYDGHLMPGSAAVQVLADTVAPLQWWLPVLITLIATAVVAVLWWLLLTRLTDRWSLQVVAFTALMFSPFFGIASGWWSAGVNALSWQITAAAVGLLLLPRSSAAPSGRMSSGRMSSAAVSSTAATAALFAGLVMTEKALTVIPALIAVTLVLRMSGRVVPVVPFIAPTVLTAAWAGLYLVLVDRGPQDAPVGLDGIPTAITTAVLPGALGGPWSWDRWNPSPSFPTTSTPGQIAVSVIAAVVVLILLTAARKRLGAVLTALAASAGYLSVIFLLLREGRTGDGSTDLLARGMHYYADWWSVSVLLVTAALSTTPARLPLRAPVIAVLTAVLFAGSATVSTATWVNSWSSDESADYLAAVREAVGDAEASGVPLPDQNTPLEVLTPLMSPYNTIGSIAAQAHGGSGIDRVTTKPRIITPDGTIAEAHVLDASRNAAGEVPRCGTRVEADQPALIDMDPALPFGDWTWEFTATADQPVTVTLTTPNGLEEEAEWRARAVDVSVDSELTTRWVNIGGGGGTIMVEVDGPPGAHVCIGAGSVGPLVAR